MKKTVTFLTACLLLLSSVACCADSTAGYGDFVPHEMEDGNRIELTASMAYAYDEPIILEHDDTNLGGWRSETAPGAYWGVTIPESGTYQATIRYSREDYGVAGGWVQTQLWNEETEEWEEQGIAGVYFDSTGDWSRYVTSGKVYLNNLEEGQSYRIVLRPDPYDERNTDGHFINLEMIRLEAFSVEDVAADRPVSGLTPRIIANDEVYYHHDSGEYNYQFNPNGTVQQNSKSMLRLLDYAIDGDTVTVSRDGETVDVLTILDPCTLRDADGSICAIPGSKGRVLMERAIYSKNAKMDEGILFDLFGNLRLIKLSGGGEDTEGRYEVDGNTVRIEADGETVELEIINRRVLLYDEDTIFYRF